MKQHILVVDDEAPVRELLSAYFKKHLFEVTAAAGPNEAFAAMDSGNVEAVILDILLADSDGFEVLARIKATHPNVPVIIMTGIGYDEGLLQEAIRKGASGYVSKTLPLDQLRMEVQRALHYKTAGA